MDSRMSRRTFGRAALAAPMALLMATTRPDLTRAAQSGMAGAVIGATRPAFEAVFGAPRLDSGFSVYDFSGVQKASYWVRYDARDRVDYIEVDFTALPGGGLTFSRDVLGKSQFIPGDAYDAGASGAFGQLRNDRSAFFSRVYRSDALSAATGRSGTPIVMDEFTVSGAERPLPSPIQRTFISMEAYEVNPIVPTAYDPVYTQNPQEWGASYGGVDYATRGYAVRTPPVPGQWLLGNYGGPFITQIDASLSQSISTRDAASLIGSWIRSSAPLMHTYWLPPSPNGQIGLRIHVFNTYRYEYVTTIQYVRGNEQTGSVDRILMAHTSQYMQEGY